ncbi:aegerolysin type hemolysin [Crepidotus variabilis]|uniref:Aegerolysin type hemolysin n=1 Tax=Crepidotus variabilis TaxID=179855 RepID=A0A9P6JNN9_9AGAR|nr:aegerolysin type hemolysin [Crepidotus variabilis]
MSQPDIETTAYAQWVTIDNGNNSPGTATLVIRKVSLSWGKFYEGGNKDREIHISSLEGKEIPAGGSFKIYSCGRENASSGTEGSYNLVEKNGGRLVRRVYWNCPLGTKTNTFTLSGANRDWVIQQDGGNLDSGALGDIKLTMVKFR